VPDKKVADGDITNVSVGQSMRQGAKWLLSGNVARQALQFSFGVVLARLLVPADFGTLVTVQIFTGLAGFVAGGGMGQALVRAREARNEDFQAVFTNQLAVGIVVYLAFFFAAPLFAHWYEEPLYTELFRVSAVSFLIRPFANMPNAWLTRHMRFKQRILIDLTCGSVGSVLAVVLAWYGFGVWSLVAGGMAGSVLSIVPLTMITPVRPGLRFDAALTRQVGLYGIKFAANDLASYVRAQTPNFVLGRLDGPALVGLFNKADSLAKTPRMVAGSIYDPLFRGLAGTQEDLHKSHYIYFKSVTLLSVYMTPLFLGLAWLAQPFIAFVYGEKWLEAAQPLAVLSLAGTLACIGYPSGAVLAARNWLGREVFVHLLQIGLFAISCLIGIQWGLLGVAWGILLSEMLSVLFIALLVKRCLKSSMIRLAASLVPGVLLSLVLCAALMLVELLLPHGFAQARPFQYMLLMSICGALVYASAFLSLPFPSLIDETTRWRKALRLDFAQRIAR
jgi:O-antigen/teichoic acid export membrane protein